MIRYKLSKEGAKLFAKAIKKEYRKHKINDFTRHSLYWVDATDFEACSAADRLCKPYMEKRIIIHSNTGVQAYYIKTIPEWFESYNVFQDELCERRIHSFFYDMMLHETRFSIPAYGFENVMVKYVGKHQTILEIPANTVIESKRELTTKYEPIMLPEANLKLNEMFEEWRKNNYCEDDGCFM